MKRVVIDTNVLVAALISPDGASREVLRRCIQGAIKLLMGNTLFLEYEDVISRPGITRQCPVDRAVIEQLIATMMSVSEWVSVYFLWRPNLRDESDNHVLELAAAGNADYIVTHNLKDFQSSQLNFPSIRVVTPAQLLEET
ncbi:putative toxin-antitoxin system toxin component, PIN family [Marinihelvus fidelis]|nr:putative toxin-antitoxin system toxin component, PIN family [Marinihelvus fidelis]